jgi:large subunit ribosomal protein L20
MVRVKRGFVARRRRKKVFKRTKGFRGGLKNQIRRAKTALLHALKHATIHRKTHKREMRSLWITRINAALLPFGMKYNQFIAGLKKKSILLDRKMLADLAVTQSATFAKVVEAVKQA